MHVSGYLEALSCRGLYLRSYCRKGGVATCDFTPLSLWFIDSPNVEKNSALKTGCVPDNVSPQSVILNFEGGLGRSERALKKAD